MTNPSENVSSHSLAKSALLTSTSTSTSPKPKPKLHSVPAVGCASPVLASVEALSQLLHLNAALEAARAEIADPYTLTANTVTENGYAHSLVAGAVQPLSVSRTDGGVSVMATDLRNAAVAMKSQWKEFSAESL